MAKHAGNTETWIMARAAVNRGKGGTPRHARGGRRAAMPGRIMAVLIGAGIVSQWHGFTAESLANMAALS